jgi:uncharacterized protein (UPF0371 family)
MIIDRSIHMKIGFDCARYLSEQTQYILERTEQFNNKLYLEFGGKLLYDYHAARVLPGYDPTAKMKLLHKLRDKAEMIVCIYAGDIERNKIRADFGVTYDIDLMRLIDDLRRSELSVNSVVITRYENQPSAAIFIEKLKRRGIKTYTHKYTLGYPTDIDTIVSEKGYGANEYITTTKPLVVVTAPGPGSGKLATCLSQIYNDSIRGIRSGYAKFETFPIWNLPLKHPVNIAYEAATADLKDVNLIDPFHLEEYGLRTINYNRDIEVFPVLKRIFEKITGEPSIYRSPTDMGVNRVGFGITDDEVVRDAAKAEIIRRYFKSFSEYKRGYCDLDTALRTQTIMSELDLRPEDRTVVTYARNAAMKTKNEESYKLIGSAIELSDKTVVTSRGSDLMNSSAALIINAVKHLADIPDSVHLISPAVLEPILKLKKHILSSKNPILDIREVLIALSISAVDDHTAKRAYDMLTNLKDTEAHASAILQSSDEEMFRNLGINITTDAEFATKDLVY